MGSDLDVRRFRPNIPLALDDSEDESHWTEAHLAVGDVVLNVAMPTIRCVMPGRAQPGFEVDRRITKAVATRAERCLGVYCWVDTGGSVRVGDDVALQPVSAGRKAVATAARRTKRVTFGLFNEALDRLSR